MAATNPYDIKSTCTCFAYSDSECACGGYVDSAWASCWAEGYAAGRKDANE